MGICMHCGEHLCGAFTVKQRWSIAKSLRLELLNVRIIYKPGLGPACKYVSTLLSCSIALHHLHAMLLVSGCGAPKLGMRHSGWVCLHSMAGHKPRNLMGSFDNH